MTITEIDINIEELLKESIPCETPDGECDSNHTEPATWIGAHPFSGGTCTQLLCDPCVQEFLRIKDKFDKLLLLATLIGIQGDFRATCHKCREKTEIPAITVRRI